MKSKYFLLLTMFYFLGAVKSKAQNTLYFMDRLPQSQQYNPALIPKVNFYLNLPAIGFEQIELNNSGFNLGELLDFTDNLGSSNYNPDEFVNSIGDYNKTTLESKTNLLSFGFKLKKSGYFSLNLSQRNFIDLTAPPDIVYLLDDFEKISERLPIHISGINLQMNAFSQLSVTWAKSINKKLTIGISPKLIGALGGISTERLSLDIEEIEPGEYETNFEGKMVVGMPVPINPSALNENGELIQDQDILDDDWYESLSAGDLFQNPGLAIDLGVNYQLDQKWSFSASFLDLGKSKWTKNAYNLYYDGETTQVDDLKDLKIKIPSKLFVGANYNLSRNWNTSLLYRNVFYESGNNQSATLSLNGYVGRMLSTSFSYTAGQTFNNLGLGLRLRFLPGTDLYVVTDNILHAINYKNVQYSAIAFGVNLLFGTQSKNQEIEEPEKIEE